MLSSFIIFLSVITSFIFTVLLYVLNKDTLNIILFPVFFLTIFWGQFYIYTKFFKYKEKPSTFIFQNEELLVLYKEYTILRDSFINTDLYLLGFDIDVHLSVFKNKKLTQQEEIEIKEIFQLYISLYDKDNTEKVTSSLQSVKEDLLSLQKIIKTK